MTVYTYHFLFQVIPFVAGGFMYIGAVAVLPTYRFLGTSVRGGVNDDYFGFVF